MKTWLECVSCLDKCCIFCEKCADPEFNVQSFPWLQTNAPFSGILGGPLPTGFFLLISYA